MESRLDEQGPAAWTVTSSRYTEAMNRDPISIAERMRADAKDLRDQARRIRRTAQAEVERSLVLRGITPTDLTVALHAVVDVLIATRCCAPCLGVEVQRPPFLVSHLLRDVGAHYALRAEGVCDRCGRDGFTYGLVLPALPAPRRATAEDPGAEKDVRAPFVVRGHRAASPDDAPRA